MPECGDMNMLRSSYMQVSHCLYHTHTRHTHVVNLCRPTTIEFCNVLEIFCDHNALLLFRVWLHQQRH